MSIIDTLIVDRNQSDRDEYIAILSRFNDGTYTNDDLEKWDKGNLRGAYNYSDINRVVEAVNFLFNLLKNEGYMVSVEILPIFNDSNQPNSAQMQHYIENIENLRKALNTEGVTPTDMKWLTLEEANEIERILVNVEDEINRVIASYVYSNQVYCGQIWEEFS